MRIKVTGQKRLRVIGLPKAGFGQQVNGCADDEYWDGTKCVKIRPYEQIFDTEGTVGGYNQATNSAYGLTNNYGYNDRRGFYTDATGKTIDVRTGQPAPADYKAPKPTDYDSWYEAFNLDYGKDLEQFNPGIRTEAGDLLYNSGVDPRIYMLDQYIKTIDKDAKGLPGRGNFRRANKAGVWTDPTQETAFNTLYNQYKDKISGLPVDQQRNLMNQGRQFYYENTNKGYWKETTDAQGNKVKNFIVDPNTPTEMNPATKSWFQRYGLSKYAGKFKNRQDPNASSAANVPTINGGQNQKVATTSSNTFNIPPNTDYTKGTDVVSPQTTDVNTTGSTMDKDGVFGNNTQPVITPTIGGTNTATIPATPSIGIFNPTVATPPVTTNNQFKVSDRGNPIQLAPGAKGGFDWTYPGSQDITGKPTNSYTPKASDVYGEPLPYGYKEPKKPKSYGEYNTILPSALIAGMSGIRGMAEGLQGNNLDIEYAKRLGQTDAFVGSTPNKMARGNLEINTGAQGLYTTPVQFAGRPTSEFVGYPAYQPQSFFRKEGGLTQYQDGNLVLPGAMTPDRPMAFSDMPTIDYSSMPAAPETDVNYSRPQGQEMTADQSEASMPFAMPLKLKDVKITSGFGSRKAPKAGASTNHNGIDLAAPLNTPVYSPMDGVVEKIYFNDKGGKQLVIHHSDGSRSGFAHLNGYDVNLNDNVSKGQLIALSGNTGNSTGPHLHFTFRNPKGEPVDPSYFFDINYQNQPGNKVSNLNHNNPGNIHIGGFAQGYGATAGRKDGAGKVAIFPDMQTGMTAMQDLIFGNAYNNLTVSQARNKWVNGSPNATTSSTTPIVKAICGDFKLNELSGPQRKKLVSEFIKWEDRGVYDNLKTKGLIYKEGGEYELDDNEIQYILANGGQIEYL